MKRFIIVSVCVAMLAGCLRSGVSSVPNAWPNGVELNALLAGGYASLYAFQGGSDGANPYSNLTPLKGALYGTTYGGGASAGWGTVFRVNTAGQEHVLYRFQAGKDGAHPYGGLTAVSGTLYGTTYQGGDTGNGAVFKISTAGIEHVIYSFKSGSDGQYPYGRLLAIGGELYGTTYGGGGVYGWGTVFKVDAATGAEHVLYRFKAGNDGAHPYAELVDVNGLLYGTTQQGGAPGWGTVFTITTGGAEHVLYSFKGGNDGEYPYGRLLAYNGTLYGTTYQGGVSTGWGTVFSLTTAGKEHVLYRFQAGQDGAHPYFCGLIVVKGLLYGTTYQGGASGEGTLFSVSTAGKEQVIYSFKGGSDGEYPYNGLALMNGTLYGATNIGGSTNSGTVFKYTP